MKTFPYLVLTRFGLLGGGRLPFYGHQTLHGSLLCFFNLVTLSLPQAVFSPTFFFKLLFYIAVLSSFFLFSVLPSLPLAWEVLSSSHLCRHLLKFQDLIQIHTASKGQCQDWNFCLFDGSSCCPILPCEWIQGNSNSSWLAFLEDNAQAKSCSLTVHWPRVVHS